MKITIRIIAIPSFVGALALGLILVCGIDVADWVIPDPEAPQSKEQGRVESTAEPTVEPLLEPSAEPSGTGMASLGRPIDSTDELIELMTCMEPDAEAQAALEFYLPPEAVPLVSEAVVCQDQNGPLMGIIAPGRGADFQAAYRDGMADNPWLYNSPSASVRFGNGFFMVNSWSYGMRYLVCDDLPEDHIPADVDGCGFTTEMPSAPEAGE